MKILNGRSLVCLIGVLAVGTVSVYGANGTGGSVKESIIAEKSTAKSSSAKTIFIQNMQKALESGGIPAALKLYDSIDETLAQDFDIRFLRASLLFSESKYDESKKICTELNTEDPSNTDVMALLAEIAKATGNKAERSKQLKALLEIDKYNADANIAYADDCYIKKQYKQARAYYERALVKDPKNQEALFGVGRSSYYLEDDAKAKEVLNQMIADDPCYAPAYSYLGKLAAANGENKVASNYAAKAVALDGSNYDYIMDYGMYERNMEHYGNAEKAWTRAIEIDPNYFLAYAYRAGLYDEQDKFTQALKDYQNVIKLNPEYYFAYESIGILNLHEENWPEARKYFTKCYQIQPDNISYPLMVTYCYYMEKNPLEAKKFSESVYRKMNRDTIEYQILRVYHDLAGEGALPQKIAAIKSSQMKGKMYFYLGLLYDFAGGKTGGKEAAAEYYTQVVRMECPMFFEYRIAEWAVGSAKDIKAKDAKVK